MLIQDSKISGFCRNNVKNAALGIAAFALLGAQVAAAQTSKTKVQDRAMQAHVETASPASRTCLPANGAQILGGFAGADDYLDVNTGEVCGKR